MEISVTSIKNYIIGSHFILFFPVWSGVKKKHISSLIDDDGDDNNVDDNDDTLQLLFLSPKHHFVLFHFSIFIDISISSESKYEEIYLSGLNVNFGKFIAAIKVSFLRLYHQSARKKTSGCSKGAPHLEFPICGSLLSYPQDILNLTVSDAINIIIRTGIFCKSLWCKLWHKAGIINWLSGIMGTDLCLQLIIGNSSSFARQIFLLYLTF